jgi:hypothetical protein
MKSFFKYFWGTAHAPGRTLGRLASDPRALRQGARAILLAGVLIALNSAILAITGAVPMAPAFLPLRTENYYFWQMLFAGPVIVAGWVLCSFLVHVLAGRGKRGVSLRKTLALFGFAQSWPLILAWIPQAIIATFFGLGMGQPEMVDILSAPSLPQIVFLAFYGLALAWSIVLSILAAGAPRKTRPAKALALGIAGEAVFVVAVILFLR